MPSPKREWLTTEEAYQRLKLDALRPLGPLVSADAPTRKGDLVPSLTKAMGRPETVRRLYESLGPVDQAAVQEVIHRDRDGLDRDRFRAKYGHLPHLDSAKAPSGLLLLLPYEGQVPTDLRPMLESFVPPPRGAEVSTIDAPPEAVPLLYRRWNRPKDEPEPIPMRQRATAPAARQEVQALLRLVEAGKVRVTDKAHRPTQATLDLVGPMLVGGDFYAVEDQSPYAWEPGSDLTIRAFAWPVLLQAAGLAVPSGSRLELTAAGRKALGQPPHAVLRATWKKWLGTTEFDEFHRIDAIKGQGKARLTSAASRRRDVAETLKGCPAGRRIEIDEFFRFVRASGHDFEVARDEWGLYLVDSNYGNLGYRDPYAWKQVQGRFILAMLFEPAATLGLLDVAYVPPQYARDDFHGRWGAGEFTCLSRYDGLRYIRINELGAWCLGLAEDYEPEALRHEPRLRVLPNFDVVAIDQAPEPADALFLGRIAERTSDAVLRLDRAKILAAAETGLDLDEVAPFLSARSRDPIPQTVEVLLADLKGRAGQLRDLGTARLVECSDAATAQLLVNDRTLKALCQLAGDRRLVFRAADESEVRSRLRKLGYVVPLVG